jgi:hypothetical protein
MASLITIFRGSTFTGSVTLRLVDPCDSSKQNPVPISGTDIIELRLPGTAGTVVLSTANSGEITITDADGTFSYKGSPTKSALLALTSSGALDCVVTRAGGDVLIFEQVKILKVVDPAVPAGS